MKRRASLLFGLGILVSLSMSVPTYAATDNTQSIPQTQEAQQNEEGTETSIYKISEKTGDGRWQLQKQDGTQNGTVVTGQNGFYIMGEYCYYVDAEGYICTGLVDAAAETTVKAVETTKAENQSESATTGDNASASTSMYTNDGVNLRSEASTDSSDNVVTTIEKGEKVEVLSNEGDWTRIKYNGKTGYVATRFLSEKNVYDE